eukprot:COSAG03_NODE_636_length_6600_cov_796.513921_2_plen_301_part_00
MSELCRPCKKQRTPKYFPWCDQRFRCTVCPNALGRDGRGYARANLVPCQDRDKHLTFHTPNHWFDIPHVVHWDTHPAQQLDSATKPYPNMIKAGPQKWCRQCDTYEIHTNGRFPNFIHDLHPHLRGFGFGLDDDFVLSDRLIRLASKVPSQRKTRVQVPYCDGLYRCLICCPQGQHEPLLNSQCLHVADLPKFEHGVFLHLRHPDKNKMCEFEKQHPKLFAHALKKCCGMCRNERRETLELDSVLALRFQRKPLFQDLSLLDIALALKKLTSNITRQDVLHVKKFCHSIMQYLGIFLPSN